MLALAQKYGGNVDDLKPPAIELNRKQQHALTMFYRCHNERREYSARLSELTNRQIIALYGSGCYSEQDLTDILSALDNHYLELLAKRAKTNG